MKVFRAEQVKEIDVFTINNEPIASIDLMERAASSFAGWYIRHFDISKRVIIFAGPGNNGGDALAIASSMNVGSHLVDLSPVSTIGALCLASAPASETVVRQAAQTSYSWVQKSVVSMSWRRIAANSARTESWSR